MCVCKMSNGEYIFLGCFACCWITGGLFFVSVGFVLIGTGAFPIGPALGWTLVSMIPLTVGCCICYCINKDNCNSAIKRIKRSKSVKLVSIDTTSAQLSSISTHMSPQVQMRADPSFQVLSHDESAIPPGQNRISGNSIHFPPVLPGYLQQDLSNLPPYQTTLFQQTSRSQFEPTAPILSRNNKTDKVDPPPSYSEALFMPCPTYHM